MVPAEQTSKSRGATPAGRANRMPVARTGKKIKGRTIYIPDDLWERIIVQSHRKDLTISEYVVNLLERHVPDHRRITSPTADQSEGEAA
jgi:hypothetical protein